MSFFKNFPIINYNFGNNESAIFQNISVHVDIFDQLVNENALYEKYEITEFDRPDTLSLKLYGSTEYYWTFYLTNPNLITQGWPISESEIYENEDELFPNEYAVMIPYQPNFDSDVEGWQQAQGPDAPTYDSDRSDYKNRALELRKTLLYNGVRKGSIVYGSGSFPTPQHWVVTKVDYNLGIIYLKPFGSITHVTMIDRGTGYDVPPKVIIEGSGKNVEAEAYVDGNGGVSHVNIWKPGYGFSSYPRNTSVNQIYQPWSKTTGGVPVWPYYEDYENLYISLTDSNNNPNYISSGSTGGFIYVDSDGATQLNNLLPTKIRFERQSDQKGRDATARVHVMIPDAELKELNVVNPLNIDWRNLDFREYRTGPVTDLIAAEGEDAMANMFYGGTGSFEAWWENVATATGGTVAYDNWGTGALSINPADKSGAITYLTTKGEFGAKYEIVRTVTQKVDGTADLPDLTDSGEFAPFEGDGLDSAYSQILRYVPEEFVDYTRNSLWNNVSKRTISTNSLFGTKFDNPGDPIQPFNKISFNTGGIYYRNLSVYNVTQGYYDSPYFDPLKYYYGDSSGYKDIQSNLDFYRDNPWEPTGGTIRSHISDNGRTGNYISGLTGNTGDTYEVQVTVGLKGRDARSDNIASDIAFAKDMIHHWEDLNGNRISFNLYDSESTTRWYDYYDEPGGNIITPGKTVDGINRTGGPRGFYQVLDSSGDINSGSKYVKITNFQNVLNQRSDRTIKVLKPDSIREIVTAFKKELNRIQ